MGLLDDLKKQADMVKSQQLSQMSILPESIKLVDAKMHETFLYLNDLLKRLAVLKPTNPTVYSIPGVGDFQIFWVLASRSSITAKRKSKTRTTTTSSPCISSGNRPRA